MQIGVRKGHSRVKTLALGGRGVGWKAEWRAGGGSGCRYGIRLDLV